MALFGNTEKAKQRSLSKILGYTRDDDKKTLDQLENEFQNKIGALPTDYNKKDVQRINQEKEESLEFEEREIDKVNTEGLQNIDITSPLANETAVQSNNNQVNTLFNDLARENMELTTEEKIRDSIISSIGEEPTLDENRLKRAKTRALVNAFGNLLQAGVGLSELQSGNYFQAQPIDNSQVLANLEGVYDDYYKELAQYRDNRSDAMLKLASLDANDLQAERKAKQDELDRQNRIDVENQRADLTREQIESRERINDKQIKSREKIADAENKYRNLVRTDQNKSQQTRLINDVIDGYNDLIQNNLDSIKNDPAMDDSQKLQIYEENQRYAEIINEYKQRADEMLPKYEGNQNTNETSEVNSNANTDDPNVISESDIAQQNLEIQIREQQKEILDVLNDPKIKDSVIGKMFINNNNSIEGIKEIIESAGGFKSNGFPLDVNKYDEILEGLDRGADAKKVKRLLELIKSLEEYNK